MRNDQEKEESVLFKEINSLDIFNLPLDCALIYLLRIAEDRSRLPIFAANDKLRGVELAHHLAREAMDALSLLLPMIYQRNRTSKYFDLKVYKEKNYIHAGLAIELADTYRKIVDVNHLLKQGIYRKKYKKNKTYFIPKSYKLNTDAQAQIINLRFVKSHETFFNGYQPFRDVMALLDKYITNHTALIGHKSFGSLEFYIPIDVDIELENMFKGILNLQWTLENNINFDNYSVGDAKKIWVSLTKLCAFHQMVTILFAFRGAQGAGMEYLPIIIKKPDLYKFLSSNSGVENEKIEKFVDDLIFNKNIKTDEIMFQPFLVGSKEDYIFFSSSLVLFSNPERNLMKLWARRYPGHYGAKIASKGKEEEKALADEIRNISKDWIVINSKALKSEVIFITDIDIGVYNPLENEVLFIQMKWCMQPDSSKEVKDSDGKLNEGQDQLSKILDFCNSKPNSYSKIFGVSVHNVPKIYTCVVSTSNIGSFWVREDYKVFNRYTIKKTLANKKFSSIGSMYAAWIWAHDIRPYIDFLHVFEVRKFKTMSYFLPGTAEAIKGKYIFRYLGYIFFSLILRDIYWFWPRQRVKSVFSS